MTERTIASTNQYQYRLVSTTQLLGYDGLGDDAKARIAFLAHDRGLDTLGFNDAVNAELSGSRVNEVTRRGLGAPALSQTIEPPSISSIEQPSQLPATFEEARAVQGHTYEDYLKRSDYSENDPDDIDFYSSDALRRHMERLHAMSDKYRGYACGNKKIEKELADKNEGGLWLEHRSLALVRERKTADNATVRIYLNPKLQDAFDIYQTIFLEANKRGLRFQSKIIDPSWYRSKSVEDTVRDASGRGRLERRDPIVFYGFDESKDELLVIVEEVYKRYSASFEGRETGAIPMPLAPGLAVGDHVTSKDESGIKESLTTHRENVFQKMPKGLSGQQQRGYLLSNHVNPDNIAFNA